MDARRVQYICQAVNLVLVNTPAGPLPFGSFGKDEVAWLMETTGQSKELKATRKAVKLMKELEALYDQTRSMNAIKEEKPAAPAAKSKKRQADLQLAIVPYVPSQPPAPRPAAAPPVTLLAGSWNWAQEFGPLQGIMGFVKPYWAALRFVLRGAMLIPLILHIVLGIYFLLGVIHLARNPEVVVTITFGLLDLIPNYAAYAGERITAQVQIEIAKRFR
jgi:hypothetical protein